MNVICPVCRSTLAPISHFDLAAPYGQRVACPVCGYPIDLATGLPLPQRYTGFNVITYVKPVVAWESVKVAAETKAASLGLQSSINTPTPDTNYVDQTIQNIIPDATKAIGSAVGGVATLTGQAAGQAAQGFLSGLGAPIVIGVMILVALFLLMEN